MRSSAVALLGFLALAGSVLGADPRVYLVGGTTEQGNAWLSAGYDVRAFLTNGVVIFENEMAFSSQMKATQMPLGVVAVTDRLAILEPGVDTVAFWADVVTVSELDGVRLLGATDSFALVAYPTDSDVESVLVALQGAEVIFVSDKPIKAARGNKSLQARLRESRKLKASPAIEALIATITEDKLEGFATYLSGEASGSPFTTRHSQSSGGLSAGDWVQSQYRQFGFNTTRESFMNNYCSNVIGEIRGVDLPNSIVILGAHLDDREANLGNVNGRAPGANDDGSGSSMLLAAAQAIQASGLRFRRTIRIANYCGEEQGLFGSRANAANYADNNVDIYAMLQGDMIAVRNRLDPIGVALVSRYTDPTLTSTVTNFVATYVPELTISSSTACCSDHQSFYELGYPSAGFVEPRGYTGDPQYHTVTDVVNRSDYSIAQLTLTTKAMLASFAELAEVY